MFGIKLFYVRMLILQPTTSVGFLFKGANMPKDLTVTALAMWGLFALGVIVGTCYCYYSDNHIDEKLGGSKGKIKLSAAIISGVFLSLLSIKVAKMDIPGIELAAVAAFLAASGQTVVATLVALLPEMMSKKLRGAMGIKEEDVQ